MIDPTKPTPCDLLAFGAHPDDLEFGCGGILARETARGQKVHTVVASRGEAATHGSPEAREADSRRAAGLLGTTVEFIELGGDAHFEQSVASALKLAAILRRCQPAVVLAPTLERNQHPDHAVLGHLVRDAARLARYGGVTELTAPAHAIGTLFYYAVTPQAEATHRVLIDVSASVAAWTQAMEAHASQATARPYIELVLSRARTHGLMAGVEHAIALYPNDPLVLDDLSQVRRSARSF